MKEVIKTKHGTVTIDLPVTFQHNEDLRGAVAFLDRIGHASNAGVSRVDYKDKSDNVIGSIVWTCDQETEN